MCDTACTRALLLFESGMCPPTLNRIWSVCPASLFPLYQYLTSAIIIIHLYLSLPRSLALAHPHPSFARALALALTRLPVPTLAILVSAHRPLKHDSPNHA
jgi:hypothetical protein